MSLTQQDGTLLQMVDGLKQELSRLSSGESKPEDKMYKNYLYEALSIMHFRLAQGDLDAPGELAGRLLSCSSFFRLFLNKVGPLSDVAKECFFAWKIADNAAKSLSFLITIRNYKEKREQFFLERKLLCLLSDEKYSTTKEIVQKVQDEFPDVSREAVVHALWGMRSELLVDDTYRECKPDDEEARRQGLVAAVFFYSLSQPGRKLRDILFAKDVEQEGGG